MRGNPSRARRRAARAVRQPSRMTDYQRHRQAEQLHGVDKIRDYLHDIDLEVLNELAHSDTHGEQDVCDQVDDSAEDGDSKRARRLQRRSKVRRMRRRHQAAAGNAAAFALFMLASAFIGAVTMLASPGWWVS